MTKTIDLHVALHPDLPTATKTSFDLIVETGFVTRFDDGDSWEDWGELLEEGSLTPRHIVFRTDRSRAWAIIMLLDRYLLPMTYPNQVGVTAAITDSEDWGENVTLVRDVEAEHQIRELVSKRSRNPHGLWQLPAWQQYIASRTEED